MKQAQEILFTVLRVFAGTLLAAVVADLTNLMAMDWADWKPVLIGALTAAGVVLINALNWKDARYGIGAGE